MAAKFYPARVGSSDRFWCPRHRDDFTGNHQCFDFSRQTTLMGHEYPEVPEPVVDCEIYCPIHGGWSVDCVVGKCSKPAIDMSTGGIISPGGLQ